MKIKRFFTGICKGIAIFSHCGEKCQGKIWQGLSVEKGFWFRELHLNYTWCFFHSFFVLMWKQISAKSAQLTDFPSV
ncbi:hypothetical protein IH922_05015 [candidate division KSB1 bacterium]|nr:hypothetical protein [candidate division KSB1 bacterium]